jgi:hypothetical protein
VSQDVWAEQVFGPRYRKNLDNVLWEECCFYTNKSGIVRENASQLLERIKARERNKETFWNTGWKSWASWVAPLVGPLTVLLMLLLLGPCVINLLTRFICNWVNVVRLQLVRQYQRLPLDDSPKMIIRDYEEKEEGMIKKPRGKI